MYEFGEGKVHEHLGGIYDWLRYKKAQVEGTLDNHRAIEQALKQGNKETRKNEPAEEKSAGALDYAAQKAKAAEIRKAEKAVSEAENDIAAYETQIAALEDMLNSNPAEQTQENFDKYNSLKRHLEQRMYEWELLAEQLETVRN